MTRMIRWRPGKTQRVTVPGPGMNLNRPNSLASHECRGGPGRLSAAPGPGGRRGGGRRPLQP